MGYSLRVSRSQRGFTLIELMTVVMIVGVLATLGLVAYRRFVTSAKTSEAIYMVGSIRAAQESFRAETLSYLNVTKDFAKFFPMATPTSRKYAWDTSGTDDDSTNWRQLGVVPDGPVYFGYKVAAGASGKPPKLDIAVQPTWPATNEPWYVIEAGGDVDANDVFCYVVGSSFTRELYIENEGE